MTEYVYRVPDVHCAHCVSAITNELTRIDGVESVQVDLDAKTVTVQAQDTVQDEQLRSGIDEAGFDIAA